MFLVLLVSLIFKTAEHKLSFTPDMTLKQFALVNDIKPGRLKSELGQPSVRGKTTLSERDIDSRKAGRIHCDLCAAKMDRIICRRVFF